MAVVVVVFIVVYLGMMLGSLPGLYSGNPVVVASGRRLALALGVAGVALLSPIPSLLNDGST